MSIEAKVNQFFEKIKKMSSDEFMDQVENHLDDDLIEVCATHLEDLYGIQDDDELGALTQVFISGMLLGEELTKEK